MTDTQAVVVPNFGELLAPYIGSVPEDAVPAFLARLERTAAQRYRDWAQALPEHAAGLLECAEREDDIATQVERIYPATAPEQVTAMDEALAPARDTYYDVFSRLSVPQQLAIQANAERQGAAAWRGMIEAETSQSIRDVLERCALTEEASADYLDSLLQTLAAS